MTCTTQVRMRAIHSRTRRYRAHNDARQLSCLAMCGTLLLAGIFTFPAILISESQRVMTSIEGQLSLDASKIAALSQRTGLMPQEIADLAQSSAVVIMVYDEGERPTDSEPLPMD